MIHVLIYLYIQISALQGIEYMYIYQPLLNFFGSQAHAGTQLLVNAFYIVQYTPRIGLRCRGDLGVIKRDGDSLRDGGGYWADGGGQCDQVSGKNAKDKENLYSI